MTAIEASIMYLFISSAFSLERHSQAEDNTAEQLAGAKGFGVADRHLVPAEQILSADIELCSLDEFGLLEKILGQVVVKLDVAQFEE